MATKLILRQIAATGVSISGFTNVKQLTTTTVLDNTQGQIATTASGNHIVGGDDTAATVIWVFQVAAVTISGTVTINFWGRENAMTTNAQHAVIVSRYNSSGTFVSDVIAQGNANHAKGVELGTADAVQNWTATPTSTTFADGDFIGVFYHADAIGTMAVGTCFFNYDGGTGGTNGDAWVQFTETIVAGSPPSRVPYITPMPPLLAQ